MRPLVVRRRLHGLVGRRVPGVDVTALRAHGAPQECGEVARVAARGHQREAVVIEAGQLGVRLARAGAGVQAAPVAGIARLAPGRGEPRAVVVVNRLKDGERAERLRGRSHAVRSTWDEARLAHPGEGACAVGPTCVLARSAPAAALPDAGDLQAQDVLVQQAVLRLRPRDAEEVGQPLGSAQVGARVAAPPPEGQPELHRPARREELQAPVGLAAGLAVRVDVVLDAVVDVPDLPRGAKLPLVAGIGAALAEVGPTLARLSAAAPLGGDAGELVQADHLGGAVRVYAAPLTCRFHAGLGLVAAPAVLAEASRQEAPAVLVLQALLVGAVDVPLVTPRQVRAEIADGEPEVRGLGREAHVAVPARAALLDSDEVAVLLQHWQLLGVGRDPEVVSDERPEIWQR
mmetsp:Transcript_48881/g.129676  ORF Transcript_48881/g.129676 Transcript_48881/m.129676 type:complete len:403 (+) Transcript_48881:80-1288(+)